MVMWGAYEVQVSKTLCPAFPIARWVLHYTPSDGIHGKGNKTFLYAKTGIKKHSGIIYVICYILHNFAQYCNLKVVLPSANVNKMLNN